MRRRVLSTRIVVFMLSIILITGVNGLFKTETAFAAVQTALYAGPSIADGSGNNCSAAATACSLNDVRNKVRTINSSMTGDIVVMLLGGTYTLSSTFQLTESTTIHDSGTNGYDVIYTAAPGAKPILSGGVAVTGWTLYDSVKNIYQASLPSGLTDTRQIYVNGVRATRARGNDLPSGWTKTSTGYTITDTTMQNWKNKNNIEVVGFNDWKSMRCPISTISGTTVTMQNNCWNNTQYGGGWYLNSPQWIENAYELLDEPGKWYLDKTGAVDGTSSPKLYYKPVAGQSMTSSTAVIASKVEALLNGIGTLNNPLVHVRFYGISFAYGTWLQPNGSEGYASGQAGFNFRGTGLPTDYSVGWDNYLYSPLANVSFSAAKYIQFEQCLFTHLGGAGLLFDNGSQNNTILGNRFEDISGIGVVLGDARNHHPNDVRAIVKNNTVKDNYVHQIGVEYHDAVGIFAGYTDSSLIEHNEIYDVPYTGVSVGFGWGRVDAGGYEGYTTATPAQNNTVQFNKIHDFMKVLKDGGGIYTLGKQPTSTVNNNYIYNMFNVYGAIYHDEASEGFNTNNNVLAKINTSYWYFYNINAKNNTLSTNYSDSTNSLNKGTNITITNNQQGLTSWPTAAQTIINNSGIEPAYMYVKNLNLDDGIIDINDSVTGTGTNQFEYVGTWTAQSQTNAYSGDEHYSNTTNDYYKVRFNGTRIRLFLARSNSVGQIAVSIDGGTETTIDPYNAFRTDNAYVFDSEVLSNGAHVLKVRLTGVKNASSIDYYTTADHVQITSGTTAFNDSVTGTGTNQFEYVGAWAAQSQTNAYSGDEHYSNTTNSYYQFRFSGSQIRVFSVKSDNVQQYAISIDGGTEITIDPYIKYRLDQALVFDSGILANASHTLKVRLIGTKNVNSSDYWATADKIVVTN